MKRGLHCRTISICLCSGLKMSFVSVFRMLLFPNHFSSRSLFLCLSQKASYETRAFLCVVYKVCVCPHFLYRAGFHMCVHATGNQSREMGTRRYLLTKNYSMLNKDPAFFVDFFAPLRLHHDAALTLWRKKKLFD